MNTMQTSMTTSMYPVTNQMLPVSSQAPVSNHQMTSTSMSQTAGIVNQISLDSVPPKPTKYGEDIVGESDVNF